MDNKILFEHFATLATAPDGIARLRELILQLAVQGKLGTQDAGDEPASVLLEKIKAEKKGKTKKPLNSDECQEGTLPFLIPKKWVWTKFENIVLDAQPGFACGERDSQGIAQLRMNNINPRGDFIWEKILRVPFDEALKQKYELKCGDVVFNNTNSLELVGKSGHFKGFSEPIVFSNHFTRLRFSENKIDPAYVTLWLHHQWNSKIFERICNKWIGQAAVNGSKLLNFLFPLPPLSEQHRIVEKVDRLMALCDELQARQHQERAGCLKLGTASLAALQNAESPEEFVRRWAQVCDAFEMILDCPENLAMLRHTILQLAVRGRLVRQELGDEPASVLLERIRKERTLLMKERKIKLESRLEIIDNEEIRKPIPPNWAVTRLGSIADYNAEIKVSSEEISEDAWVFDLEDIEKETSRIIQKVRFKDRPSLSSKSRFRKGDVLYGKLRPYLDKVVVADEDGYCTTEIVPIRPYHGINPKYLRYTLKTPDFLAYVNSKTYGIKMPRLGTADAINAIISLPPIAEQHRIVEKVDALMALCDALESRLKERAGVQGRLAGAVVKGVTN